MRMVADLARPAEVHDFRDPIAGDVLKVVTAFPPARGIVRNLDYVDFDFLRSVHGLVVKPENQDLDVTVDGSNVFIDAKGGLSLSALDNPRPLDGGSLPEYRSSYIDFIAAREDDPRALVARRNDPGSGAVLYRQRLLLRGYRRPRPAEFRPRRQGPAQEGGAVAGHRGYARLPADRGIAGVQ
jgi:hypothetical protein